MKQIGCFVCVAFASLPTISSSFAWQGNVKPTKTAVSIELVKEFADSNGFNPSGRVVLAIVKASQQYHIDVLELSAIATIETGMGKFTSNRKNNNGTIDRGLFQINTVNVKKCIEYNLDSPEGSALCAAKLLSQIKIKHKDYLGRYHSKTPDKKANYIRKITKVLQSNSR
jgi:hypothetical protein